MKETICLVDLTIPGATDIDSLSCSVLSLFKYAFVLLKLMSF